MSNITITLKLLYLFLVSYALFHTYSRITALFCSEYLMLQFQSLPEKHLQLPMGNSRKNNFVTHSQPLMYMSFNKVFKCLSV